MASLTACKVGADQVVVVLGAGPMGLMHLKLAKWMGAVVIIVDLLEDRLDIAKDMGADHCINPTRTKHIEEIMKLTGNKGAQAVIASLGIPSVIEENLQLTGKGGTFNIFGGPPAGHTISVDPRWLHYCEINLTGTFAASPKDFEKSLGLIINNEITVDDLVTDRFTLDTF